MGIMSLTFPHWIWWGKGREAYLSFRHQIDSSCLLLDCFQNIKKTLSYFTLKASGSIISRRRRKWKVEEHWWVYEVSTHPNTHKYFQWSWRLPTFEIKIFQEGTARCSCSEPEPDSHPHLTFDWKSKSDSGLSWIRFQISFSILQ